MCRIVRIQCTYEHKDIYSVQQWQTSDKQMSITVINTYESQLLALTYRNESKILLMKIQTPQLFIWGIL